MDWGLYLFLAGLGVLTFGLVGGWLYVATRRRWPRVGKTIGAVVVVLLLASVVPAPLPGEAMLVSFAMEGKGSVPVAMDPGAPFEAGPGVTIGEGRVGWDCPSRCYASGGTLALKLPPYARSVGLADGPGTVATLENGSLDVYESRVPCPALPLLFATLFGAFACEAGCRDLLRAQGTGERPLVATGTRLCV